MCRNEQNLGLHITNMDIFLIIRKTHGYKNLTGLPTRIRLQGSNEIPDDCLN